MAEIELPSQLVTLIDSADTDVPSLALLQKGARAVHGRAFTTPLANVTGSGNTTHVRSYSNQARKHHQVWLNPGNVCICLMFMVAFVVVVLGTYEVFLAHGGFSFGNQSEAGTRYGPEQVQYWLYCFLASAGGTAPLATSLSLGLAMGIGATLSGLLVTGGGLVVVIGARVGKSIVKPWDQCLVLRFAVACRIGMACSLLLWVCPLCSGLVSQPWILFGILMASRIANSFFQGASGPPMAMMAIKATPKEDMTMMQSTAASARKLGACAGLGISSLSLTMMNGTHMWFNVYQMSAMAMAVVMVMTLLSAAWLSLVGSRCERVAHTPRAVGTSTPSGLFESRDSMADYEYQLRGDIVFWGLSYDLLRSLCTVAIECGLSMLFETQFDFSVIEVGWLLCLVLLAAAVLQQCVGYILRATSWDESNLMMVSALVCMPCVFFLCNFGPWWQLFLAGSAVVTFAGIANGISDGISTKATIPDTPWSAEMFSANRCSIVAVARFSAGPVARGFIALVGRNGFAALEIVVIAAGAYVVFKMHRNVQDVKDHIDKMKGKVRRRHADSIDSIDTIHSIKNMPNAVCAHHGPTSTT